MTRLFIILLTSLSLLLGHGITPAGAALPSDMGSSSESRAWLLNNKNDPLLIENTNLLNNENPEDLDYMDGYGDAYLAGLNNLKACEGAANVTGCMNDRIQEDVKNGLLYGGGAAALLMAAGVTTSAIVKCLGTPGCVPQLATGVADAVGSEFAGTSLIGGGAGGVATKYGDDIADALGDAARKITNKADMSNVPDTKGIQLIDTLDPLPSTGGRTTQFQKTGGFDQANADFDALDLSNIREINIPGGGTGRVGELPDGTKVVVRSRSSENRSGFTSQPTLEIQYPDGSTKIRY